MYAIASLRLNSAPHDLQRNVILRHDRSIVNWPSQARHFNPAGFIIYSQLLAFPFNLSKRAMAI
jgi:hypothetical protein